MKRIICYLMTGCIVVVSFLSVPLYGDTAYFWCKYCDHKVYVSDTNYKGTVQKDENGTTISGPFLDLKGNPLPLNYSLSSKEQGVYFLYKCPHCNAINEIKNSDIMTAKREQEKEKRNTVLGCVLGGLTLFALLWSLIPEESR